MQELFSKTSVARVQAPETVLESSNWCLITSKEGRAKIFDAILRSNPSSEYLDVPNFIALETIMLLQTL